MRHLRLIAATITLICAFSFTTYAGDIECDGRAAASPVTDAIVALVESVLALV